MIPFLETILILPFLMAIIVALKNYQSRLTSTLLTLSAPIIGGIILLWLTPSVMAEYIIRATHFWVPNLGLNFNLRLDGLAWMFVGLIVGIGSLVVVYAHYYLSEKDNFNRFYCYLLLFMGAMLGMVMSSNLLLLMVFWELTSISSFLLIGFWSHLPDARQGARMALMITGGGGLCLLAGILLIGNTVNSFELDVVLNSREVLQQSAIYPWALCLVLVGIFSKSAQFPLHFWLPHAMAAPTPVSAYLHSATMVKAGVFLLARLHPVLAGTDLFFYIVSSVGAITLVVGAWNAIFQHDLKGLLAYSTISHLGLITLLFGLSTPLAVVAGVFHILNHAVFKASLFMAAGIIDHETGTRDMRRLGNLRRYLPITSVLAITASLAMAGIPLLNGFLSKEMFFAEAIAVESFPIFRGFIITSALLAGMLGVAYSLRFVRDTFFGQAHEVFTPTPHDPPRGMRAPVMLLAIICVVVGIFPALTVAPILHTAVKSILLKTTPEYHLALWHGFNIPLLMSGLSIVGGISLFFILKKIINFNTKINFSWGKYIFEFKLDYLFKFSAWITRNIANSSLQRSLFFLLVVTFAAAGIPLLSEPIINPHSNMQPIPLLGWILWIVLLFCTLSTISMHRRRLLATIVIGGVGLVVSLVFVFLSAPDLALTQLLVEMVTLTLMLMALNYLPKETPRNPRFLRRWRDTAIALFAGVGVTYLAYSMMLRPSRTMAGELLQRSLPEAHGLNVVNVILVDFRGFDTLGEITVLGMAGLIIHALLRRTRMPLEKKMPGPPMRFPVPADLTQIMFPLTLTVSIYLFLRGHNAPGGGFVAGLVLAIPLLIQYVIQGAKSVESRFGFDYVRCIGFGLLMALLTGIMALVFNYPFLTSGYIDLNLPIVGNIALASAIGFDIGVYLVVFGSVMLMLTMMGTIKPSLTQIAHYGMIDPTQRSSRTGEVQ